MKCFECGSVIFNDVCPCCGCVNNTHYLVKLSKEGSQTATSRLFMMYCNDVAGVVHLLNSDTTVVKIFTDVFKNNNSADATDDFKESLTYCIYKNIFNVKSVEKVHKGNVQTPVICPTQTVIEDNGNSQSVLNQLLENISDSEKFAGIMYLCLSVPVEVIAKAMTLSQLSVNVLINSFSKRVNVNYISLGDSFEDYSDMNGEELFVSLFKGCNFADDIHKLNNEIIENLTTKSDVLPITHKNKKVKSFPKNSLLKTACLFLAVALGTGLLSYKWTDNKPVVEVGTAKALTDDTMNNKAVNYVEFVEKTKPYAETLPTIKDTSSTEETLPMSNIPTTESITQATTKPETLVKKAESGDLIDDIYDVEPLINYVGGLVDEENFDNLTDAEILHLCLAYYACSDDRSKIRIIDYNKEFKAYTDENIQWYVEVKATEVKKLAKCLFGRTIDGYVEPDSKYIKTKNFYKANQNLEYYKHFYYDYFIPQESFGFVTDYVKSFDGSYYYNADGERPDFNTSGSKIINVIYNGETINVIYSMVKEAFEYNYNYDKYSPVNNIPRIMEYLYNDGGELTTEYKKCDNQSYRVITLKRNNSDNPYMVIGDKQITSDEYLMLCNSFSYKTGIDLKKYSQDQKVYYISDILYTGLKGDSYISDRNSRLLRLNYYDEDVEKTYKTEVINTPKFVIDDNKIVAEVCLPIKNDSGLTTDAQNVKITLNPNTAKPIYKDGYVFYDFDCDDKEFASKVTKPIVVKISTYRYKDFFTGLYIETEKGIYAVSYY
ncbi:MAG: hypothetical protein MSH11_06260 [Ruminococcus sp.]|nr:hypothetical protein [Ruminococcus sp.]